MTCTLATNVSYNKACGILEKLGYCILNIEHKTVYTIFHTRRARIEYNEIDGHLKAYNLGGI